MKLIVILTSLTAARAAVISRDRHNLRAAHQQPSVDDNDDLYPEALPNFHQEMVNVPAPAPAPQIAQNGYTYAHYKLATQKADKRAIAAEERADDAEERADAAEEEAATLRKKLASKSKKSKASKSDEKKKAKKDKKAKKAKEGKEESKGVKGKAKTAAADHHRNFAAGFVVTIVMTSIFVMLAHSRNKVLAANTWVTLDAVICLYLALEWYIVVKHGLDYFNLHGYTRIFYHAVWTVFVLLVFISVKWRTRNPQLAEEDGIVDGIFHFFVMWTAAGLTETVNKELGGNSKGACIALIFVMMLWYCVLGYFVYLLSSRVFQAKWGDDLVTTMAGSALAGGFVMWSHLVISGSLQEFVGVHENPPDFNQTLVMLALGVIYMCGAIFVQPRVDKVVETSSYVKGRFLMVLSDCLGKLPYFSFLCSLGHLILDNSGFKSGATEAHLALAVVTTVIALLMITLSTIIKDKNTAGILLGIGGFVLGGAWGHLFDNECNALLPGTGQHPFLAKLALITFISAFLFPAYLLYLKPLITEKLAAVNGK